jgi:hypothetical protein
VIVLVALLLLAAATGGEAAELYDCPALRRALLPLAGLDRMPEDRVARFSSPPEFLCSDVNAESIVVYPGRARRGRQALEVIGTFVERPAGGAVLRHTLRAELVDGETVVASADARPWEAARPTRTVVKVSLEVGEARLREVLSRSDPPLLRLTLDLSPPKP